MPETVNVENVDSIVKSVITKFVGRAKVGLEKYGTDLDRQDLKTVDWITHAQEELMDGILYLEKLKHEYTKSSSDN
jgi:hypothetical protein